MALTRPILVSRTRRKASRSVRKVIPLIGAVVVACVCIWSLLPVSDVRFIDLRGVTWTSREEIQLAISQGMSGRVVGLVPRTRWLFSSTASMKDALGEIPTLSEINVWKIFPGTITVHVKEDRAWATMFVAGKTYVVGTQGQMLGDVSTDTANALGLGVEVIRGEISESERYGIGEHLFIEERARAIERWNKEMKLQGFLPSVWKFSSPHAPDVSVALIDGWELRIDPTAEPTKVLPQVRRVLDEVVKDRKSSLQSIDARSTTALYPRFK